MILPLLLLSASLALVVYWVAGRMPLPPAPAQLARRPTVLAPLERLLERDLHRAGLTRIPGQTLLTATFLAAGLGALAALPLNSPPLTMVAAVTCGLMPLQLVKWQARRRARALRAAAETALTLIARLYAARRHPALAISDALPGLPPSLKAEFALAMAQSHSGAPLPEALRALAARCGGDFYLYQFAELVALNAHFDYDVAGALGHLVAHMQTQPALHPAEPAWLLATRWLGQVAAGSTAVALLYWALTRPLGAVVCLSVALASLTYALLLKHPRFSPRQTMLRRLGQEHVSAAMRPALWRALDARRRRRLLARAWPALRAHLAIQTDAGADLPTAFASSLPVLREPLRAAVEDLVADLRTSPLPAALERFAQRCDLPAARAFVEETTGMISNPSAT